jgi:hypothetical protein
MIINNQLHNNDKNLLIDLLKKRYINDIYNFKSKIDNKEYTLNNVTNLIYITRYIKLLLIYNNISLSKVNTVCTVFKLVRNKNIINYAYIYGFNNNKKNNIENQYIITSNSLISKDGEYKQRFIPITKLNIKSIVLDKLYKYINQELKNKEFNFQFTIFNINNKQLKNKYLKLLRNYQLSIKVYIITWLTEIYQIYINDQDINKNEQYNMIIFSNKDLDFFKELYKNHKDEINMLLKEFNYFNSNYKLSIGQKLIPFNYIQLKEYNNLIHFQWKELLINKIITNVVYNKISPCFSLFIDWILIKNTNRNLYDNIEIYKKILYSDKIKEILNYFYLAKNDLIELNSYDKKEIFINKLLTKLKSLIKSSESNILMSNISLCYFSEYSGKTIYDYLNKLINNQINPHIGNLFLNYELFSKYLFEIIYSLYCLNLKGIIHGDLHLNNITLTSNNNINDKNENNYIIYNLNNNINEDILDYLKNYKNYNIENISSEYEYLENCYIFKNNTTNPCIIDFSRSFILINLIDEDIIEKEKNKIRNNFIKVEKRRIINELNKIFPNYIKNNAHKIKFLFKNQNFNILFLYFSAYDIFTFSTNLLIFMKKISTQKNINLNDKIINLLTDISKKSYSYLEMIIDENNYNNSKKIFQFPNYLLLKEFFNEYLLNSNNISNNINNIYSLKNITKYNKISDIKKNIQNDLYKFITDDKLKSKFNNILNYNNLINEELDIEKIINNEYYNIKSNLYVTTSELNNSLDTTFDVTTNSISISNY